MNVIEEENSEELSNTIPRPRNHLPVEFGTMPEIKSEETKSGCLDIIKEKLLSRKLLAFGVASYLFSVGQLTEQSWMVITIGYMGIQGMGDMVKLWKEQK
jgi:hypothetical protein